MTSYSTIKSPVGDLLLIANQSELLGLYFCGCDHIPAALKTWTKNNKHPVLQKAAKQLREYFDGKRRAFSFPPGTDGTDFQKRIWREISKIPFGETISYSDLAKRAGAPQAIRAAGTATGRNPLGIVIPCHRVVGKDGGIGGYAGGLDRKRLLLNLEQKSGN